MKYTIVTNHTRKVLFLEEEQIISLENISDKELLEKGFDRAFEKGYQKAQEDIRRALGFTGEEHAN